MRDQLAQGCVFSFLGAKLEEAGSHLVDGIPELVAPGSQQLLLQYYNSKSEGKLNQMEFMQFNNFFEGDSQTSPPCHES